MTKLIYYLYDKVKKYLKLVNKIYDDKNYNAYFVFRIFLSK